MVCMAIEGAMQVKGGNWQIFDRMLNASRATVLLNTTVTRLSKDQEKYKLSFQQSNAPVGDGSASSQSFDTVILAAPLLFSDINTENSLFKHKPDVIPYVQLHVTLFASPCKLSPQHFNLKPGEEVPNVVLTTLGADENPADRNKIVGKSGFFSISSLRSVLNPKTLEKEYLYKIFSPEKLTSKFLRSLLDIECELGFCPAN